MRVLIVTDAWMPQVNGVVVTLLNTIRELERLGHEVGTITPDGFATIPCRTAGPSTGSPRPNAW